MKNMQWFEPDCLLKFVTCYGLNYSSPFPVFSLICEVSATELTFHS